LIPVFLTIAVGSVYRFGTEKSSGALELLVYGPADGTSYFIASYLKDLILAFAAILLTFAFMTLTASLYNYVAGSQLLRAALVVLFLSLAVFAYGVLDLATDLLPFGAILYPNQMNIHWGAFFAYGPRL
jgi:hypothetical protein